MLLHIKNARNTAGYRFSARNSERSRASKNKLSKACCREPPEGPSRGVNGERNQRKSVRGSYRCPRAQYRAHSPCPKDQPVSFSLPKMQNALDAPET